MEILVLLMVIMIVILVISLILNILFNPYVWLILAILFIFFSIRGYLYRKQVEDYDRQFYEEASRKREQYRSRTYNQTNDDDVIDATYTEREDKN